MHLQQMVECLVLIALMQIVLQDMPSNVSNLSSVSDVNPQCELRIAKEGPASLPAIQGYCTQPATWTGKLQY